MDNCSSGVLVARVRNGRLLLCGCMTEDEKCEYTIGRLRGCVRITLRLRDHCMDRLS